jgi:hypothetical protein
MRKRTKRGDGEGKGKMALERAIRCYTYML